MEQNLWLAAHHFSVWHWKLGGTVKKNHPARYAREGTLPPSWSPGHPSQRDGWRDLFSATASFPPSVSTTTCCHFRQFVFIQQLSCDLPKVFVKLFNRLIVSAGERQTAAEAQLLLPKERSQKMSRHNCQLLKSISLTVSTLFSFHICHFSFFYILLCFIIGQGRELLKRNSLLVFSFAHSCSTGPFTFYFPFFNFYFSLW